MKEARKLIAKYSFDVPNDICSVKCMPIILSNYVISILEDGLTGAVWKPADPRNKITLIGHTKPISTMTVSPADERFLCTCSTDKVIVWDLGVILRNNKAFKGTDSLIVGITVCCDIGYIENCCFSWCNSWLGLSRERDVWLLKLKFRPDTNGDDKFGRLESVKQHTILDSGCSNVNFCSFSPENVDTFITVEENSYFKVWSLPNITLLYQSSSLGMHSISYCSFVGNPPRLLLGTNSGTAYVYVIREQAPPHCIMQVNVSKAFQEREKLSTITPSERGDSVRTKFRPSSHQKSSSDLHQEEWSGEHGCIIFTLQLVEQEVSSNISEPDIPGFSWDTTDIWKAILTPGHVLVVCSNLGIAVYDCNSWDCLHILPVSELLCKAQNIPFLVNFLVAGGKSLNEIRCLLKSSIVDPIARFVCLGVNDTTSSWIEPSLENTDCHNFDQALSIMSHSPLSKESLLRTQMNQNKSESLLCYKTSPTKNQRKLKSSGYGKPPRTKMFQPIINKPINHNINKMSSGMKHQVVTSVEEMLSSGPPVSTGQKISLWDTSGNAVHLAVTGSGSHLACSSTSSHVCILRFASMNLTKSLNLIGHDGNINSLHFSLNSNWLISSSNDFTAKVWDWKNQRCIIDINKSFRRSKLNERCDKTNAVLGPITGARFFYLDKFFLTSSANRLELYCHCLDQVIPGTKQLISNNFVKNICVIEMPSQKITCFSAANQFHSNLVLCGCSNKTIQVYDLNHEAICLALHEVHARAPHALCQMEGNNLISHAPGMMDLFVTSSVCDSVKLWDLRSARCVQRYNQHICRAYNTNVDISPCGRFIAVGSEDKHVYIYDTRKNAEYLAKLNGLGDIVMDVIFNPTKLLLAAAALNGSVVTYTNEG